MEKKKEIRFFAEKIKPLVREGSDTSSNNILDVIDFIKRTEPDKQLKLYDGRNANFDNLAKELNEDLSQTIVYIGESSWTIIRMEREI